MSKSLFPDEVKVKIRVDDIRLRTISIFIETNKFTNDFFIEL